MWLRSVLTFFTTALGAKGTSKPRNWSRCVLIAGPTYTVVIPPPGDPNIAASMVALSRVVVGTGTGGRS